MSGKRSAAQSKANTRAISPALSRSDTSDNSSQASSPTDSTSKTAIDFQFLNFSHPSEAKASPNRKAVRSHVTREQHRREHAAAAAAKKAKSSRDVEAESEASSSYQPSMTLDLPHRPITSPTSAETSSSSTSPSGSASPLVQINPRDVYPEDWRPYLPHIMEHYASVMAPENPDLDGPDARGLLRSRFYPFLFTDIASLHATMLVAAAHYIQMRNPRNHPIDILHIKGMAIREINSALENPQRMVSDQLVAAVAKMASYEALFGDQQIFNTHMTGLLRMVSLRGGLPALGLDGLLERILLWIDANAAHINRTHVYFDRAAFPTSARHPRPDPQRFLGGILR